MNSLVVIVGPTGVGKTAVAIEVAEAAGGEIVSADSRQVYRGMDIGTAKPMPEERRRVAHHLIDVVNPDEPFTLAEYQRLAYAAIDDIAARGKLPLLVGGTGLYVRTVTEGLAIPHVPPNPELRARLRREAEEIGAVSLHARLQRVDPIAASRIDPRNVRRVIRALEVYEATGAPISHWQRTQPPSYHLLRIGLTMERAELYRRIDARIDAMMAAGLVDEVRGLVARGYSYDLPSMSGLGYQQIGEYLRGEVDLAEAVRRIKSHTRRFVRHQYTWFRLDDMSIRWFEATPSVVEQVLDTVRRFL
jgi:tRNA dimethylallyltransferase